MKTPLVLTALFATALLSTAADWPQWRGPNRDDISKETGLLKQWPEGGPKMAWLNKDIGLGYSGYSIVGGRLFTMGLRGDIEHLIAVDTKTGKELWATPAGAIYKNGWGDGPRATPTVDGDMVFAMSGGGTLLAAKAADGKEVWKAVMRDFGGKLQNWGYTESVLVDQGKVICTPGGSQGTLLALDRATGKKVWQSTDWTDDAQYSSPIVATHNGVRQYIQLTQKTLAGINAMDGKLVWKTDWNGRIAVIPTPIFKDGHVYIATGYGIGCKLVKLGMGGEVTEVYKNNVMENHHGGVVLVGDHLYGYSEKGGWTCQDFKSGEAASTFKGLGKGAIHHADGLFYLLSESNGKADAQVMLVEASPKAWTKKGEFPLTPQTVQRNPKGRVWTHPVVSDGKLYLRDQELLFCFNVKGK